MSAWSTEFAHAQERGLTSLQLAMQVNMISIVLQRIISRMKVSAKNAY